MDKNKLNQKKSFAVNYVYATLIGILVIACAVTIALVGQYNSNSSGNVGRIPVAGTTYVVPMKNAVIQKDYSATELQYNDTLKQWEIHRAVDFVGSGDLSVLAIADGTVSNIYTNYLEGTVIEIMHNNNVISIYKSLAKDVNVAVGGKVNAGQTIGQASDSMTQELNTGVHLHFEMTINSTKVDPNDYLALGDK